MDSSKTKLILRNEVCAVAAICRNDGGLFLGASVLVIRGIDDPASAEDIACCECLTLASDLALGRFIWPRIARWLLMTSQREDWELMHLSPWGS